MKPLSVCVLGMLLVMATFGAARSAGLTPAEEKSLNPEIVKKLVASDGLGDDQFGTGVSVSGDTLAAGAPFDDDAGADSGSVYIFERHLGGFDIWGSAKKITVAGASRLGEVVSISGDTLVVSAIDYVHIFERDEGGPDNWGLVKSEAADRGNCPSIDGDTIVAGTFGVDNPGAALILMRNQGGPNNWGRVKTLVGSGSQAGAHFGLFTAIDGDTAVVAAPFEPGGGAAYVFERNRGGPNNWAEERRIVGSDLGADGRFGSTVGISGDTAVAGTLEESAYVFERHAGGTNEWGEVKKLTASDGTIGDEFGAVAIHGDLVIASAWLDDDAGVDAGSVYFFERDEGGMDNWGEIAKLTAPDAAAGDTFGFWVAMGTATFVVGAVGDDDVGFDSGSAYVGGTGGGPPPPPPPPPSNVVLPLISAGALSVAAQDVIFPPTSLAGVDVYATATDATWTATDTTGLGAGWHVTLTAEDHLRGDADPANHVIFVGQDEDFTVECLDSEIVIVSGTGPPPTCPIGAQPIPLTGQNPLTMLWAAESQGMGIFDFLPHFEILVPGSSTIDIYRTELLIDIIAGP